MLERNGLEVQIIWITTMIWTYIQVSAIDSIADLEHQSCRIQFRVSEDVVIFMSVNHIYLESGTILVIWVVVIPFHSWQCIPNLKKKLNEYFKTPECINHSLSHLT